MSEKKKTKWIRNCPTCGDDMVYSSKYTFYTGTKQNSNCRSCSVTKSHIIKKKLGRYRIFNKQHDETTWEKECIKCGEIRIFTWEKSFIKSGDICVSCSQIKNTNHCNEKYRKYRGKVWTETCKQPVDTLEHIEKRGKSGIANAYQLDHIISIKSGFDNGTAPEIIGNICNLQMLPWLENRKKSNK